MASLTEAFQDTALLRTENLARNIDKGGLNYLSNGPLNTSKVPYDPSRDINKHWEKSNASYSGTDCTVVVNYNQHMIILGNIETITYSIHRDKTPVRTLGRIYAKDYVRGCIDEDEYITTKTGIKKIKDISIGDMILSYNNINDVIEYNKCINKFDNGIDTVFEVKLQNGSHMNLTDIHRVFTNTGWKQVKELTTKDKLMVNNNTNHIQSNINIPDYYLKLLAYGIGNGVFGSYKNGKETRFSLTPGINDKKVIQEIKDICYENKLTYKEKFKDNCYNYTIHNCINGETDWRKRIYHKFIEWTKNLGIYGKYSHTKFIPDEIINMSNNQMKIFLSRLFTTDGCFIAEGNRFRIQYTSTSKLLITQLELIIKRFGINCNIYKREPGINKKHNIIGKHVAYNLIISSNYVYKFLTEIGIYGKELKYNKHLSTMKDLLLYDVEDIKKIKNRLKLKAIDNPLLFQRKTVKRKYINEQIITILDDENIKPSLFKKNYIYSNIKSITEVGKKHVYDLEIENNHNLFGSFLSHNSRTIAGSLVFIQFDEHPLYSLFQFFKDRTDNTHRFTTPLADDLPAFDMILIFNNEYGAQSVIRFYGIDIMEEGSVYSINDMFSENVMQFVAKDMDPMVSAGEQDSWKRLLYQKMVEGKVIDTHFASLLRYRQKIELRIAAIDQEMNKSAEEGRGPLWKNIAQDKVKTRREARNRVIKLRSDREILVTELDDTDISIANYERTKMSWDLNSGLEPPKAVTRTAVDRNTSNKTNKINSIPKVKATPQKPKTYGSTITDTTRKDK